MIEMHLVVGSVHIPLSTLITNQKEIVQLWYGVVAPCFKHHGQGDTTPLDKSWSLETTALCISCVYISVYCSFCVQIFIYVYKPLYIYLNNVQVYQLYTSI